MRRRRRHQRVASALTTSSILAPFVAMPFAPSSFLLLVVRLGATSSVLHARPQALGGAPLRSDHRGESPEKRSAGEAGAKKEGKRHLRVWGFEWCWSFCAEMHLQVGPENPESIPVPTICFCFSVRTLADSWCYDCGETCNIDSDHSETFALWNLRIYRSTCGICV